MQVGKIGQILTILGAGLVLTIPPQRCLSQAPPVAPAPDQDRLAQDVSTLASPAFEGRSGRGARLAEKFLVERFRRLGLKPLFGESYTQDILRQGTDQAIGRNVGGWLEGTDPALANEWILLGAHYDHNGIRNGILYPGADDNASGVAMLLEAARCLTELRNGQAPSNRRSIAFVGFDLEEWGLIGSIYFADHPPRPLDSLKLMIAGDMLSRALGGVCKDDLFAIGTEHVPELRPLLSDAARELEPGLVLRMIGNDILGIDRSDYGPFRRREIPYVFFSTGENPRYHTPDDRPETIDAPKLTAATRLVFNFLQTVANAPTLPGWTKEPAHELSEAVAIRDALKLMIENQDQKQLAPLKLALIRGTLRTLDAAIERGSITPEERRAMVRQAQVILYTVL